MAEEGIFDYRTISKIPSGWSFEEGASFLSGKLKKLFYFFILFLFVFIYFYLILFNFI